MYVKLLLGVERSREEWQFMTDIQTLNFSLNGNFSRLPPPITVSFLACSKRRVQIRKYMQHSSSGLLRTICLKTVFRKMVEQRIGFGGIVQPPVSCLEIRWQRREMARTLSSLEGR